MCSTELWGEIAGCLGGVRRRVKQMTRGVGYNYKVRAATKGRVGPKRSGRVYSAWRPRHILYIVRSRQLLICKFVTSRPRNASSIKQKPALWTPFHHPSDPPYKRRTNLTKNMRDCLPSSKDTFNHARPSRETQIIKRNKIIRPPAADERIGRMLNVHWCSSTCCSNVTKRRKQNSIKVGYKKQSKQSIKKMKTTK